MSTFYIQNHADWQSAIIFSQDGTNTYTNYVLMTDLTFDIDNHMYLNSTVGSLDTDYLYIRGGQTFDGNNHTLTVTVGSEFSSPLFSGTIPPNSGLKGIFRAMGSSLSELATITNVKVVVQSGVVIGQSVVVGNITSIPPNFTKYENIIVDTRVVSTKSYSIITAGDRLKGVFFKNIFIYCEGTRIIYACCYGISEVGSFENMIFISGDTNLSTAHFSLCSSIFSGSVTAKNCYIGAPYNTNTSALYSFFQFIWDTTSIVQLENAYISLRTYSTTYSNTTSFLINGVKSTSSTIGFTTIPPLQINLINCYTNINRTGTLTSSFIRTTLSNIIVRLQNCQNNFTWNKPAVFSEGFNTSDTGPYRLSSFLSYPFNSNTYSTYISMVEFLDRTIFLSTSFPPTTTFPTIPIPTTLLPNTTFLPTITNTTTLLPNTTFLPSITNTTTLRPKTTFIPLFPSIFSAPKKQSEASPVNNNLPVAPPPLKKTTIISSSTKKNPPKSVSKIVIPSKAKATAAKATTAKKTKVSSSMKEKYEYLNSTYYSSPYKSNKETFTFQNEFSIVNHDYKTLDTAYTYN